MTKKRSIKASDDIKTTTDVPATATYDVNAKVTPHKLCAVCMATVSKSHLLNNRKSDIDITLSSTGYTERWEHFAHHPSLEVLKASARDGCHLCTRLCNIVNEKSIDQVIEDDQKKAKDDVPDPMEGYGPSALSALNVAPQERRERKERRERRMQQLSQMEDSQHPRTSGIVLELRWGCNEWDKKIEPKWGSYVSINLELNWHLNHRMETNGRYSLSARPTKYIQSQGQKWEANRDDPIKVVHDAQISASTESAASFNWLVNGWPSARKNTLYVDKLSAQPPSIPSDCWTWDLVLTRPFGCALDLAERSLCPSAVAAP